MVQFAGTRNNIPKAEEEKLFAAGVSFLCSKAFPAAYACFARITKHCVVSWWDGMMSVISCFVKLNILYPAAHYQVWSGFRKLFSVTSMRKTDLSIRCLKVPHLHLHTRYFCV